MRAARKVNPALWDWEAFYGKAGVRGRNVLGAFLVFGLLLLGSIWYLGLRQEGVLRDALAASADEHGDMIVSSQQTTCVLALAQQGTLSTFLEDRNPDAWNKWCWWISKEPRRRTPR